MTSAYEGFPIALLEATRSGLPIVSTDVGGVSEIVLDNHNGLLFPLGQRDEMADGLIRLIENPDLLTQFSLRSRALSDRFLIGESTRLHLDVYAESVAANIPGTSGT